MWGKVSRMASSDTFSKAHRLCKNFLALNMNFRDSPNSYRPSGWPVYNRELWCDSTVHNSICDDNHVMQCRGDVSQWLERKAGRELSHRRAHDRDVRKPTVTPLTIEKRHVASWGLTIFVHE